MISEKQNYLSSPKLDYQKIKRISDVFAACFAMVTLLPVFAAIAVLIRSKIGNPIVFCQTRPGIFGKPFTLYKFRTMTNTQDSSGRLLPDEKRITKLGAFLRRSSLDELPEFWNILKGDMSLVGPRPLLMEYLPYYKQRERKRHLVRPGLTGFAQVSGRNYLKWDERLELDAQYVENLSFKLDFEIILKTIRQVIIQKDTNELPCLIGATLSEYRKKTPPKT